MTYVLGIDVGTTGTKAVVIDESGRICGSGYEGYGLITSAGGYVEQDADSWYIAAVAAIRQAIAGVEPSAVTALSMSTQGASLVLVDENFNPLCSAITWMDSRAVRQKEEIESRLGEDYVYRKTGWKPHVSQDLAKIRWLKENREDLFNKAACFITTQEYMNRKLTGENIIDPTNAAIRQLMDIRTKEWDEILLGFIPLDKKRLPRIVQTGEYIGLLTREAANDLGLNQTVRVYNGGHDQYCGMLGANITRPGELLLSTGTAWAMVAVTDKPMFTSSSISFGPHIIPGKYGALASIPTSGAAYDWMKNNIVGSDYDTINSHAQKRIEACAPLLFYPYFTGAGYPNWNPNARASILGLGLENDKYDLALACMEGVAFQLRMALDDYAANGIRVDTVRIIGGATKNSLWMRILSSLIDCSLYLMSSRETACTGAAAIAAAKEGMFTSYEHAAQTMNDSIRYPEDTSGWRSFYEEKYKRYKNAWLSVNAVYSENV
jgi:xylulokinase